MAEIKNMRGDITKDKTLSSSSKVSKAK